jgi:hypothetical protein
MKEQVKSIAAEFARGLRSILKKKLYGAYIFGAAAFPDDVPTGDIDFHVILAAQLTENERSQLYKLHDDLAAKYPPLAVDMDGYYIILEDARGSEPPQSQMWQRAVDKSWALHRQHIRAGRYIKLHGPDPKEIYRPATWAEIERALEAELEYADRYLEEYPHYSLLQFFRLAYTYENRDPVISKAQAARWAQDTFPRWMRHIELARKAYAGQATEKDKEFLLAGAKEVRELALKRIEQARQGPRGQDFSEAEDNAS